MVVRLLRSSEMRKSSQQSGPHAPGALPAAVLLLLHVIFGSVEREHAELREETLQDGSLPGYGPQLLRLHHDSPAVEILEILELTAN